MTEETEVPQGIETSTAYIVQYDENLWFSLTGTRQDECKARWTDIAKPLELDEVVLRLIPDPIFPAFGKEKPYVHWRHKFSKVPEGEWTESVTLSINTNDNSDRLDTEQQLRLTKVCNKYAKGTRVIVRNLQGKHLWEFTL